jgi:hypothetical protein
VQLLHFASVIVLATGRPSRRTSRISRRSDLTPVGADMKKWVIGAAGVGALLLALSRDSDEVRTLRVGQFTLVEHVHVTRHPYTHIADSGGDAFLPIPMSDEAIVSQRLESGTRTVWSSTKPHHVDASPDGGRVVVRSHNADEPWRVVSVSGAQVIVPIPSDDSLLPNEKREYPFHFIKWANGGADLLLTAYSKGWRSVDYWPRVRAEDPPVRMTTYVRIWAIDPRTGSSRVTSRCEMPFTKTPDWTGYPCAFLFKQR